MEITRFGWARPPRDPGRSPAKGRYPVRIENLGNGLYGYVANIARAGNNPATPWNDKDALASCMVLNRNFVPFPGTPLAAMQATVAHEFNHSIQYGYGALSGYGRAATVLVEGGATWMEDEVFDGADDNWNYLWPSFTKPMGVYKGFPYPYWIVLRAMAEPLGTGVAGGGEDIYQTLWEQISKEQSTNLTALNRAFQAKGSSLATAYHRASIALRFLENCATTAPPYCLQEGPDYPLAGAPDDMYSLPGDPGNNRKLANDYALHWVGLPTTSDVDLVVDPVGGGARLRVSIACLTGDTVTVLAVGTATGPPRLSAMNYDASLCDAASVVISNVKQTSPTPKKDHEDHVRHQRVSSNPCCCRTCGTSGLAEGVVGEVAFHRAEWFAQLGGDPVQPFQVRVDRLALGLGLVGEALDVGQPPVVLQHGPQHLVEVDPQVVDARLRHRLRLLLEPGDARSRHGEVRDLAMHGLDHGRWVQLDRLDGHVTVEHVVHVLVGGHA